MLYRINAIPEVFLVHPGGPFFINKDAGSWSIPKGEFEEEDPLQAARREFAEETGSEPKGPFTPLIPVKQKSGKIVYAWAVMGELDETKITCNTFRLEWPPRSGKFREFPEVDKGGWFTIEAAREKILAAQLPLLSQLEQLIG